MGVFDRTAGGKKQFVILKYFIRIQQRHDGGEVATHAVLGRLLVEVRVVQVAELTAAAQRAEHVVLSLFRGVEYLLLAQTIEHAMAAV